MIKSKYILALSVFILMISACLKTVDNIKLPKVEPKLVVCSYISPSDTIIKVNVSMSVPVFYSDNNSNNLVTDAIVTMWNDFGTSIVIPYDNLTQTYFISSASLPILAGQTYHIKVTSGDKMAESSCTVPSTINTSLEYVSMDSTIDQYGNKLINVKVKFTDTPNEGDYYRVYPVAYTIQNYSGTIDTVGSIMYVDFGDELVSDKNNDGQTYNYIVSCDAYNTPSFFKVFLFQTDKHYYELHKSLFNNSGDDPFSEPTIIYTNMIGGYGVFAAYNSYSIKIDM